MKIINTTNLKNNLRELLNIAGEDKEEIIVTRKDEKNVVLISLEKYNRLKGEIKD